MQIWPAIDIRGGMCVRLEQGDYGREKVFHEDPTAMARQLVAWGAQYLHLVDLDGAKAGRPVNWDAISGIVRATGIPCELGGGIRDEQSISKLIDLGLSRLVIGTKAVKEPTWFREMCQRFPHKLALGLDARNGQVATDGWLETSSTSATELAKKYADLPLASIIYTDIQTDGMMLGPNFNALAEMRAAVDLPLIASGGVTTAGDVAKLTSMSITGCIIGRALYEGRITIQEALTAAGRAEVTKI